MTIHGTRVKDDSFKDNPFRPGTYGRVMGLQEPGKWDWAACTPNGHLANLAKHDVVENEDGTITVSPSILVEQSNMGSWHGFLEHGNWRQV
jgi:hypothetical protein